MFGNLSLSFHPYFFIGWRLLIKKIKKGWRLLYSISKSKRNTERKRKRKLLYDIKGKVLGNIHCLQDFYFYVMIYYISKLGGGRLSLS